MIWIHENVLIFFVCVQTKMVKQIFRNYPLFSFFYESSDRTDRMVKCKQFFKILINSKENTWLIDWLIMMIFKKYSQNSLEAIFLATWSIFGVQIFVHHHAWFVTTYHKTMATIVCLCQNIECRHVFLGLSRSLYGQSSFGHCLDQSSFRTTKRFRSTCTVHS